jgi:hypothetical protein
MHWSARRQTTKVRKPGICNFGAHQRYIFQSGQLGDMNQACISNRSKCDDEFLKFRKRLEMNKVLVGRRIRQMDADNGLTRTVVIAP